MISENEKLYTAEEAARELGIPATEVRKTLAPVKVMPAVNDTTCTVEYPHLYRLNQKKKDETAKIAKIEVLQMPKSPPKSHSKRPANDAELIQRRIAYQSIYIIRVKYDDGLSEEHAMGDEWLAMRYVRLPNVIQYFQENKRFCELYPDFVRQGNIIDGIKEWFFEDECYDSLYD